MSNPELGGGGPRFYDYLIVGSGFGGSITAMRLSAAGRSVCMLEKGKRWDPTEYPRTIHQASQAMWEEKEHYGFLDYRVFNKLDVIQGCGLGGGSLHYFNVTLRPSESIFRRPEWPAGLNRQLLDPYFDLAQEMNEAAPIRPDSRGNLPARTRVFLDAAQKIGRASELVPLAIHQGENRFHPSAQQHQAPCDWSSSCLLGCKPRSKNSLDMTYIPAAERAGLEVRVLCEVDHIRGLPQGGYEVHYRQFNPDKQGEFDWFSVRARELILAAGSLGSTEILLRSRDLFQTLPNLSSRLGERFSGNGDMLFAAAAGTKSLADPAHGPSITAGVDMSRPGSPHTISIQDLGLPAAFFWLLEGLAPSRERLSTLLGAAGQYLSDAFAWEKGGAPVRFEADRLLQGGSTSNLLPFLGMGTDAADGKMTLDSAGRISIDWDPDASAGMFEEMQEAMKELSNAAGGEFVPSFLYRWPARRVLTAHPLGGCAMGLNSHAGVVDHRGQVFGHPGLYVVDSAIIPGPLAVNPSATISALAERCVWWMLHGAERPLVSPVRVP